MRFISSRYLQTAFVIVVLLLSSGAVIAASGKTDKRAGRARTSAPVNSSISLTDQFSRPSSAFSGFIGTREASSADYTNEKNSSNAIGTTADSNGNDEQESEPVSTDNEGAISSISVENNQDTSSNQGQPTSDTVNGDEDVVIDSSGSDTGEEENIAEPPNPLSGSGYSVDISPGPTCFGEKPTIRGTEDADYLVGTAGDDVIMGLGGGDEIVGNGGDDIICGGDGNDEIAGGDGEDRIDGGPGSDLIRGEDGSDELYGSRVLVACVNPNNCPQIQDHDTIEGGEGDDVIKGSNGRDRIYGGPGNNSIKAYGGDDMIVAEEGHDRIYAGDGNDRIIGGEGNNWIDAGEGNDDVEAGSGNDYIDAGAGNDEVVDNGGDNNIGGEGGDDVIKTGDGADEIDAGAGDDLIRAGHGDNIIYGGSGRSDIQTGDGHDVIYGGEENDVIQAGEGRNIVHGYGGDDDITTGFGDDRIEAGSGSDRVDSRGGNNRVIAGDGNNEVKTGDGRDIIQSGSGNDEIDAGGGGNKINAGEGNNDIWAGDEPDEITTGDGIDYIRAGNGDNKVLSGGGFDSIETGMGSDYIDAGAGVNTIVSTGGGNTVIVGDDDDRIDVGGDGDNSIEGGAGNNQISVGSGNDRVVTGDGSDEISAEGGFNIIYAGAGDDEIRGGIDIDELYGENGNDRIEAGSGDDYLNGGRGIDMLDGGEGIDICVDGEDIFACESSRESDPSPSPTATPTPEISPEPTITEPAPTPIVEKPAAVDDLSIEKIGGVLKLTWSEAENAEQYNIYRSTEPYFAPSKQTIIAKTTRQEFVDSTNGIIGDPEKNYYYVVRAENAAGESGDSNRIGEFDYRLESYQHLFIAPPFAELPFTDAEGFAEYGGLESAQIMKWDALSQGWEIFIISGDTTHGVNFPIKAGEALSVQLQGEGSDTRIVTFVGRLSEAVEGVEFKEGKNHFANNLLYKGITSARELAETMLLVGTQFVDYNIKIYKNQGENAEYIEYQDGNWEGNDFELKKGYGYFVEVGRALYWKYPYTIYGGPRWEKPADNYTFDIYNGLGLVILLGISDPDTVLSELEYEVVQNAEEGKFNPGSLSYNIVGTKDSGKETVEIIASDGHSSDRLRFYIRHNPASGSNLSPSPELGTEGPIEISPPPQEPLPTEEVEQPTEPAPDPVEISPPAPKPLPAQPIENEPKPDPENNVEPINENENNSDQLNNSGEEDINNDNSVNIENSQGDEQEEVNTGQIEVTGSVEETGSGNVEIGQNSVDAGVNSEFNQDVSNSNLADENGPAEVQEEEEDTDGGNTGQVIIENSGEDAGEGENITEPNEPGTQEQNTQGATVTGATFEVNTKQSGTP